MIGCCAWPQAASDSLHHKKSVHPEEMVTQVSYQDDNGRTWKLDAQEVTPSDIMRVFVQHFGTRLAPGFLQASAIAQLAQTAIWRRSAERTVDRSMICSPPTMASLKRC